MKRVDEIYIVFEEGKITWVSVAEGGAQLKMN